jgi:hypothetical protein
VAIAFPKYPQKYPQKYSQQGVPFVKKKTSTLYFYLILWLKLYIQISQVESKKTTILGQFYLKTFNGVPLQCK